MTKEEWSIVLKAYVKGSNIDFGTVDKDGNTVWNTIENEDIEGFNFKTDVCRVTPKPRSKKEFLENTKRDLTDAECAEWMKLTKSADVYFKQTWEYSMGRIGNVHYEYGKGCSNGDIKWKRERKFDWRPLGHYSFTVRDYWNHEYMTVEGYIQSWEDLINISDTDNLFIELWKHPHQ